MSSAFWFDKQSHVTRIVNVWLQDQLSHVSLNSRSTCLGSIYTSESGAIWNVDWSVSKDVATNLVLDPPSTGVSAKATAGKTSLDIYTVNEFTFSNFVALIITTRLKCQLKDEIS